MEMFSKKFPAKVNSALAQKNLKILATIPSKIPGGGPLNTLLESVKSNAEIIHLSKSNRDSLLTEITCKLLK